MSKKEFYGKLKSVIDLRTMTTITVEDLRAADFVRYNEIRRQASKAWRDQERRYVCSQCGHYVYAPSDTHKRRHWSHYSRAPQDCPWWTGMPDNPNDVSARQFHGNQEGTLHFNIKHLVARLLEADPNAECIEVEKYIIEEKKADDGIAHRRKPDVSALYAGSRTAFEVQLATTQLPLILAKEEFYARNDMRLVWLTWEFQERPLGEIKQAFADIYCTPEQNIFSLDARVIERSQDEGVLHLRAHAFRDGSWKNEIVPLHAVSWNESGLPYYFSKPPGWEDVFRERWIAARARDHYNWEEE